MAMSGGEIDMLVEKLRAKYGEFAAKYSPRWFNRDEFEERYRMALRNRMNLEGFILAEISNFEKIKERYEKKKDRRSFSEKIDRIIEENNARIAKYPKEEFHPRAGFEISHFYGAVSEFAVFYYGILWGICGAAEIKKILISLEERFSFLAVPRGSRPPKRVEDHCILLDRRDVVEIEIERDRNEYLKESAFLLHDTVDLCDRLIEMKDPAWETPLRFDNIFVEEQRKKRMVRIFSGMTGYGAILAVREQASQILEDFRLGAFRRQETA